MSARFSPVVIRAADFDWQGTLSAVTAGTPEGSIAIAGNVSDGVCLGSFPLAADGNFQLWVFSDAYKATITKEAGRDIVEVEEDVYETYNLACLLTGATTDANYKSQGVRINSSKYTLLRDLGKQTFAVKLEDGSAPNVTIDSVRVLKSRDAGLVLASKGPYYFAMKYKSDPRSDPSLAMAEKLAMGFYWAVGPDA
jgi:hypothetical protein